MTRPALRQALEELLQRRVRRPLRIVRMTRRPWAYGSSHTIEDVDVRLDDGREIPLVLKDVGWDTMLPAARRARPAFLHDSRREIEAYRRVLRRRALGTPLSYGVVNGGRPVRTWLVLERVDGPQLRHVGEFAVWQTAAAWLGRLHRRFAPSAAGLASDPRLNLIRYDAGFMQGWLERARLSAARGSGPGRRARLAAIQWIDARYGRCVDVLAARPRTIMHGDLFASNVIVRHTGKQPRICVLDWETMAIGPGLVDLAALASGNWTDDQRDMLLRSYQTALTGDARPAPGALKALRLAFACSQIHLAVRMAGWAADRPWRPPGDLAQDWLEEAVRLARTLKL